MLINNLIYKDFLKRKKFTDGKYCLAWILFIHLDINMPGNGYFIPTLFRITLL